MTVLSHACIQDSQHVYQLTTTVPFYGLKVIIQTITITKNISCLTSSVSQFACGQFFIVSYTYSLLIHLLIHIYLCLLNIYLCCPIKTRILIIFLLRGLCSYVLPIKILYEIRPKDFRSFKIFVEV